MTTRQKELLRKYGLAIIMYPENEADTMWICGRQRDTQMGGKWSKAKLIHCIIGLTMADAINGWVKRYGEEVKRA